MVVVLETENLYVYMYIYHHCHQYHYGCHSHRYCYWFYNIIYGYFRTMFIKSKIEPLTMALSKISSGLEPFGFLNVMIAKSKCHKLKELNVYKIFLDFVESSFMDGKVILKGFIYL